MTAERKAISQACSSERKTALVLFREDQFPIRLDTLGAFLPFIYTGISCNFLSAKLLSSARFAENAWTDRLALASVATRLIRAQTKATIKIRMGISSSRFGYNNPRFGVE